MDGPTMMRIMELLAAFPGIVGVAGERAVAAVEANYAPLVAAAERLVAARDRIDPERMSIEDADEAEDAFDALIDALAAARSRGTFWRREGTPR